MSKLKEQFLEVQKDLTLKGNVVLSVGVFGHSGSPEAFEPKTKEMLTDIHKCYIVCYTNNY